MRRKKPLIIAAVVGLFALGAGVVHAGPWSRGGDKSERARKFVEWKLDDALDELDATEAQRAQVEKIVFALFDEGVAKLGDREVFREELLSLWQQPSPDAAAAHALVEARIEVLRALAHQAVDSSLEVHKVLDAKQRDAVADFVRSRAGRHH
ncbi:MAG: hypothetical protein R3F65_29725 [bacterium]|nr:periplasmic heavy metal sensor [Myxococcales bacterium]